MTQVKINLSQMTQKVNKPEDLHVKLSAEHRKKLNFISKRMNITKTAIIVGSIENIYSQLVESGESQEFLEEININK